MGWQVKQKEIDGETHYKIWSTVTDEFFTDEWQSREQITKFLFWHRFQSFVDSFIEDAMTFPEGYTDLDADKIIRLDEDKVEEFWKIKMSRETKIVYEKLFEELDKVGIKINISDGKYSVNNTKEENKK